MPSLKSRAVALFLRHTRKRAFQSAAELNRWIAAARLRETHRPPAAIASRLSIRERTVQNCTVYVVEPSQRKQPARHILYFHGGAYVFEMTSFHWNLIAEMAERLDARITVPAYPLAPEHKFEAIFAMALDTYRSVLRETEPADLIFMGDSAGGNMAVVLTMMAAKEGLPVPARHVLISPGLDVTLQDPQEIALAERDPWLDIEGGLEAVRHYAPHIPRTDWRISPINGDLTILPPTLILAGEMDILTHGTMRFAEKARQAGVDLHLVVEPGMVHVWPLIDMPEARHARDAIVSYITGAPIPPPPTLSDRLARLQLPRLGAIPWRPAGFKPAKSGVPRRSS